MASVARLLAALSISAAAGAAVLSLACRAAHPAPSPAASKGWNLLLVTLDTLRADHLGCYGRAGADTPALDRLAAGGIRFAQAQAAVPLTLPSHATILSGLLPPRHGLRDNGRSALPADVTTLATDLAQAGYRTGAFVGAFVLDHRYGLARGFATYDDDIPRRGGALEAERPGAEVVDRALAWLLPASGVPSTPFFGWVHLYDAHAPYTPPEPFKSRHPGDPYSGEVAGVDYQVGRLLAGLQRRGLAAHTLVAVAGDHGESLGEHGELTHGLLLYQGTLRVPLLLSAPGVLAPRVVTEPVGLADLAPTLAALLGHPLPGRRDGRDLSPALLAGREPAPADLYAETRYPLTFGWSPLYALRRQRLKYVQAPRAELYDLAADPAEAHDLRAGRRREATSLAQSLAALGQQQRDAAAVPVDAEAVARLQALGYAAPAGASRPAARDPKDAVRWFRVFEEAHRAQLEGRLGAAAALLAPLVEEDPGNAVFRSSYGRVLRDQGRLEQALALYRQAVALTPTDPQAWYELATALQEAGKVEEARAAFEEALRRDPGRPEAHNALAIVLAEQGRLGEARRHLEIAAAADPRDPKIWNNLGNVLRALGDDADAAATAYQRAIALDARYPDPLNGLGALEVSRRRPAAALPWFERALALAPQQHEARLNRGIALEMMGDPRRAGAAYRDFLDHTSGDAGYAAQRQVARQLLARLDRQAS